MDRRTIIVGMGTSSMLLDKLTSLGLQDRVTLIEKDQFEPCLPDIIENYKINSHLLNFEYNRPLVLKDVPKNFFSGMTRRERRKAINKSRK